MRVGLRGGRDTAGGKRPTWPPGVWVAGVGGGVKEQGRGVVTAVGQRISGGVGTMKGH